jgi:hypothetical protein
VIKKPERRRPKLDLGCRAMALMDVITVKLKK